MTISMTTSITLATDGVRPAPARPAGDLLDPLRERLDLTGSAR